MKNIGQRFLNNKKFINISLFLQLLFWGLYITLIYHHFYAQFSISNTGALLLNCLLASLPLSYFLLIRAITFGPILAFSGGTGIFIIYQYFTYFGYEFINHSTTVPVEGYCDSVVPADVLFCLSIFKLNFSNFLPLVIIPVALKLLLAYYEIREKAKKKREIISRLELARMHEQITPHFILNNLNYVYSLVEENNRAANNIEALTDLIHYSLYSSRKNKIHLSIEIQFIETYLVMLKKRLSAEKEIHFLTSGEFSDLKIVPMILVPIVENCIKFGLFAVEDTAHAFISISVLESSIHLETRNNRPTSKLSNGGFGMDFLRTTLEGYYPKAHHLAVKETQDEYLVQLMLDLK